MEILVLKETAAHEKRVAATPDSVKKLVALGASVTVESNAGSAAHFDNASYETAGASITNSVQHDITKADIVLSVQKPDNETLAPCKKETLLIGLLSPFDHKNEIQFFASQGIHALAMEFIPRITRAQSMDALSSQSNLAGYKAVLDALAVYGKVVPMMMTAAGTVPPAKVLVMGAGVAGLQAIATAKRLGAVVSAFDVRPAVKEQVESLGGKFIEVESDETETAETKGGYAKEMSEDYKKKQEQAIQDAIKKHDIVITTALIPGKPAPVLITETMVQSMKPGSVIVDLAVTAGGNCPLSERDNIVEKHGVTLVGHSNIPSRLATDASKLYANNIVHLLTLLIDKESKSLTLDLEDDIIKGALLTHQGNIIHPMLSGSST